MSYCMTCEAMRETELENAREHIERLQGFLLDIENLVAARVHDFDWDELIKLTRQASREVTNLEHLNS